MILGTYLRQQCHVFSSELNSKDTAAVLHLGFETRCHVRRTQLSQLLLDLIRKLPSLNIQNHPVIAVFILTDVGRRYLPL